MISIRTTLLLLASSQLAFAALYLLSMSCCNGRVDLNHYGEGWAEFLVILALAISGFIAGKWERPA